MKDKPYFVISSDNPWGGKWEAGESLSMVLDLEFTMSMELFYVLDRDNGVYYNNLGEGCILIHFIVADNTVKRDGGASIFPYNNLAYVRVHPEDCKHIQEGLKGMFGTDVPVFEGDNWEEEAEKLLFGGISNGNVG